MDQRLASGAPIDHGDPAEAPHQARSEAHPDAVAAAGDQAAADVHARTGRTAEPGDGREPDARGGADRGAPGDRGHRGHRQARRAAEGAEGRHLGRPGLRVLLRRLPRRRLPARAPSRRSRNCRRSRTRSRPRRRSPTTCSGSCRFRPTTTCCARSARPSSATSTTTATWWPRSTRSRRWAPGAIDGRRTRALELVQGFDPIGVAARDLQECLWLQLRQLGLEGTPTERIVTEHLRLLQNHQVPELARKLGHLDRRAQAAHRDHPAPRSEAGQPLQPAAVAVRDPRRLRGQGRRPVRRRC